MPVIQRSSSGVSDRSRYPAVSLQLPEKKCRGGIEPQHESPNVDQFPLRVTLRWATRGEGLVDDRLIDQCPQLAVIVDVGSGDELGQVDHDEFLLRIDPVG